MNLILFAASEIGRPLPRADRRAVHILEVLRRKVGDSVDVGVINGPRGKAVVQAIAEQTVELAFTPGPRPPPLDPITLIVGLPRPQTARDILRDATTLGVASLHFVRTEKSDPNYAQSTLWSTGEWTRHAIAGAEQAFDTRVPDIRFDCTLAATLQSLSASNIRLALDNYEAAAPLSEWKVPVTSPPPNIVIALGGERGWSASDRDALRANSFTLVHLGQRVLRTETAVVAALILVRAKLGLI